MWYIILILFLLLHIWYQHKTCDDLEIHSLEFPGNDLLEKSCRLKQPLHFKYPYPLELDLKEYGPYDIMIEGKPLSLNKVPKTYISHDNQEFLQETRLFRKYEMVDEELRPYLCAEKTYDLLLGNTHTPVQQKDYDRTYLYCVEGNCKLRIATPRNYKYIHDKVDIWNIGEDSKIKYKEIVLKPGEMIFIPAYWWYSMKLEDSKVAVFHYRTWMNVLSIVPNKIISHLTV